MLYLRYEYLSGGDVFQRCGALWKSEDGSFFSAETNSMIPLRSPCGVRFLAGRTFQKKTEVKKQIKWT